MSSRWRAGVCAILRAVCGAARRTTAAGGAIAGVSTGADVLRASASDAASADEAACCTSGFVLGAPAEG